MLEGYIKVKDAERNEIARQVAEFEKKKEIEKLDCETGISHLDDVDQEWKDEIKECLNATSKERARNNTKKWIETDYAKTEYDSESRDADTGEC